MLLSATISCSLVTAITFDLVSQKILFFFHWKAQSFNLIKHQNLMSATFSHFQQGQNIRLYGNIVFELLFHIYTYT